MAHKVFICHSSKDKLVADAACAALEAHRIPCWIAPRDILAGEEYGASIIDALDECQIVLLIFSLHANNSPQVRREIERAVSKEKILVPYRIEDVLPSRAMEFALMNTHWLDALTPPMEHRLTELCNTILRLIQKHTPVEPPLWQQPPHTQPPPQPSAEAETLKQREALQQTREEDERRTSEEVQRIEREAAAAEAKRKAEEDAREQAKREAEAAEAHRLKLVLEQQAREDAERRARVEQLRVEREQAAAGAKRKAEEDAREKAEREAETAEARRLKLGLEQQARADAERLARVEQLRVEREEAAAEARRRAEEEERKSSDTSRQPFWKTPIGIAGGALVLFLVVAVFVAWTHTPSPQPKSPQSSESSPSMPSALSTPQPAAPSLYTQAKAAQTAGNLAQATDLFKQDCTAGDQNGCTQLKAIQAAQAALDGTGGESSEAIEKRKEAARKALDQ